MTPARRGLLLIGHGTRDVRGRDEFLQLVERVAALGRWTTQHCYLELAEPTIEQGVAQLAAQGVSELVAAPVLLFEAGHAKRDIPDALAAAVAKHPALRCTQAGAINCHPAVVELSADRFRAALAQASPGCASSDSLLLLVGRGSHDPQAYNEFQCFAERRRASTPVAWLRTCFLAMTEPRLDWAIRRAVELPPPCVVIQPHLLFHGELLNHVRNTVEEARVNWPHKQWLLAEHLGPDRAVARALDELAS